MRDLRREITKAILFLRPSYEEFHAEVLRELNAFRHEPSNLDVVYRLYSRADKQKGGEVIKSVESIQRKLSRWRTEGGKWEVRDIHDIVAWTIVTYFNSEIEALLERLKRPNTFNCFSIGEVRPTRGKGYYAYHIELEGAGRFKIRGMKGELQIKSLLSDGWATRTRTLSYRTTARLDSAVEGMISSIGDMIQNLERQSDNLRELITRYEELDRERRSSAIKTSAYALTQAGQYLENDPYGSLAKKVFDSAAALRECRADDKQIIDIVSQWRKLVKEREHSLFSSRFIVFLALFRNSRDLDDIAFDAVETWVGRTENEEYLRALGFRAWAYYALGDIDGAVNAADEWLRQAQKLACGTEEDRNSRLRAAMLENAYFRAERVFANPSMDKSDHEREYIRALIKGAPTAPDKRHQMVDQDTKGAITIMIATTTDELITGRKLCQAAHRWGARSKADKEVFSGFYQLHEQRYHRRLRELA